MRQGTYHHNSVRNCVYDDSFIQYVQKNHKKISILTPSVDNMFYEIFLCYQENVNRCFTYVLVFGRDCTINTMHMGHFFLHGVGRLLLLC